MQDVELDHPSLLLHSAHDEFPCLYDLPTVQGQQTLVSHAAFHGAQLLARLHQREYASRDCPGLFLHRQRSYCV